MAFQVPLRNKAGVVVHVDVTRRMVSYKTHDAVSTTLNLGHRKCYHLRAHFGPTTLTPPTYAA